MRTSGSSDLIFGKAKSGYSNELGGYVTKDGRFYPSNNPYWKPKSESNANTKKSN